ncbi:MULTISPECIES: LacI family DNA-binding transcriptional regulator [unclassified Agrobacterium]|uniref:Transcriptional regulator n=1 Tax=Agrobacterium fabrum TaxID=1176649 RepID=A0A2W5EZR7_9HYPH|nr:MULTISPECIES: LacI family DNA-binding transcriptional regulator [unclassified Agrobacterium]PZP49475.1 MAG: transcriptional regulator [Agrobacterium fabrum]MDH0613209.1 LacI family transcriptional regulator [Agrobacterium sp. GD03872]MDH0695074.1 LacI family transcriptional regulator [Agrobacterium sp. GD03871]MDH1057528.1 LacI family transcriptional regulator [Agrobacterium sp. GD03992]MDH2208817.1 LacI family transcriptional regulator [Agrobacterium sp. GD03643]
MNLKQLSQLLGISQTTISRALNGYPEVSAETRRRVMEAAEKTGYRPNAAAQRLATGKVGSIGLVMPIGEHHRSDVHFGEFLSGLGEEASRSGFHLVIMPTEPEKEREALRGLAASGSVDGIYLAYMKKNDPRIAMMQSLSLPFLVHGRSVGVAEDYPYLDVDNEGAFRDATQLLLQLGHTRIGLLNGPEGYDFTYRRCLGVEKALAADGLSLHPDNKRHSSMTDEEGYLGMEALLSRPERPTAILCASTALALGAIRSLNQRGLKPGRDVSLIAHDDVLPLLKPDNFSVPLTTTRSSLRAAGVRVGQRLINRIKLNQTEPYQELWKAELVVRASTGPAPKA